MKLAWIAALGLLVSSAPVLAQSAPPPPAPAAQGAVDPERLALAREMTQLFDVKAAMQDMFASMARSLRPPASATPEQTERFKQFLASYGTGFASVTPDLMDSVATLYAMTFTAQEMRDALSFYRSESGQAMLKKMPMVMHEIMPLTMELMPKIISATKADYCSHRTCDKADEAMFAAMAHAYGKPAT